MTRTHFFAAGAMLLAFGHASTALADVVYQTWTIRNNSEDTANDLHVNVKKAAPPQDPQKASKAESETFSNPPAGVGSSTLDWPNPDDPSGEVEPGDDDRFALCTSEAAFVEAHFTLDGEDIGGSIQRIECKWLLSDDQLSAEIMNPEEAELFLESLDIFVGNDLANFAIGRPGDAFPYHEPTGDLVISEIGVLLPGEVRTYELGPHLPNTYALCVATFSDIGGDVFFFASGFAAGDTFRDLAIDDLRIQPMDPGVYSAEIDLRLSTVSEPGRADVPVLLRQVYADGTEDVLAEIGVSTAGMSSGICCSNAGDCPDVAGFTASCEGTCPDDPVVKECVYRKTVTLAGLTLAEGTVIVAEVNPIGLHTEQAEDAASNNLDFTPVPCTASTCPADLDGDIQVSFQDLLIVLANWGPCP